MDAFINEEYKTTIKYLTKVRPDSKSAEEEISLALGISYLSLDDNENAKKYLNKTLNLNPENTNARTLLDMIE